MSPLPDQHVRPGEPTPEEREARIRELREKRFRRLRTLGIRSAIGTFAVVVAVIAFGLWLLTTVGGRDLLLAQIQARLPANATLEWERAEGPARGPLVLHGVRFTWDESTFTARRLMLDPRVRQLFRRRLLLEAMAIEGATLDLGPSDEPFELPRWPESLPQVKTPLPIFSDTVVVDGLRVTREQAPVIDIERIRGGLAIESGRVRLDDFTILSDRGRFMLDGRYAPAEHYLTDLTATAVLPAADGPALRLGMVARGDLDAMVVGVAGRAPEPLRATLELRGAVDPRWRLAATSEGLDTGALLGSPDPAAPLATLAFKASGVGGVARVAGRFEQGDLVAVVEPSRVALEEQVLVFDPLDLRVLGGRVLVRGRGEFAPDTPGRIEYKAYARGLEWGGGEGGPEVVADAEVGIAGTQALWGVIGRARLRRDGETAQVRLDGLGREARLTVREVVAVMPTGRLTATGRVDWRPRLEWALQARLAGFDPGYFVPTLPGELSGALELTGRQLDSGQTAMVVEVPKLGGRLRGRVVGVSGKVAIEGPNATGTAALVVDDGRLVAQGTVGSQPTLHWDVDATLDDFDPSFLVDGWPGAVDAIVSTEGRRLPAPPGRTGELVAEIDVPRLGGTLRGRALSGHGEATVRGDAIRGEVELAAGDSRLVASGVVGPRLDIDARFSPLQLNDLLPDATGVLRGAVRISGPRAAPDIAADLTGRDIVLGDYRIGALEAEGHLPWTARGRPGALTIQASGLQLGTPVQALDIDARGSVEALQLEASALTDLGAVELAGTLRRQPNAWQAGLAALSFDPVEGPDWRLQSPATLRFGGGQLAVNGACLASSAGGVVCAEGGWPGAGIDIDGRGLPLSMLAGYLPATEDGRGWAPHGELVLDGHIEPAGNGWRGQLVVTSPRGGLRLADRSYEVLRYDNLRLRAAFAPAGIEAELQADLFGDGRLAASVTTGWSADAPLSGSIDARLDDLTWMELFSPDIVDPTGELVADLGLRGSRAAPELTGQARLTRFSTEIPSLGIELTQGQAVLAARPEGGALIDGRVRSGEGVLGIDGWIDWRAPGVTAVLDIEGRNVLVADTRQVHAIASPDVQVRIAPDQPVTVTGEVRVPTGVLRLERLDSSVKVSGDVVVLDPANPQADLDEPSPVALDLNVIAGENVQLEGFGLDGEVEGALRVQRRSGGTLTARGRVEVSGEYEAYGQQLQITRGRLAWSGGPIGDPRLDIRAERQIGDVTAGISVRGRAKAPQAEVFSSEGTTQSEALSYLALGRPLGTVTGEQGEQISAASAALSAGGNLLAAQLGARLGLDDAGAINSRTLGGSVFGIGKYLSPKLYVGYGVSLLGTGQVATLKYLIGRGFIFELESGSVETRAAIYYSREK